MAQPKTLQICLPCGVPQAKPHHDLCQGWFYETGTSIKVPCECLHGGSSGVPPMPRNPR